MKKILLFLLFPVFVSAQVGTSFNGKLNIFASSDLGGNVYQITGLFNDENGLYSSSDVVVGDYVYVSNGASCARLRVNTINSDIGGIINADVSDVDAVLVGSPTGICAIMRETPTFDYPVYVPGISQSLLSCIQTHFAVLADQVSVTSTGGWSTVTIIEPGHGFSQGAPVVFNGSWVSPTSDTMIATYVVVDSVHEDTFTAAASGTFTTSIADGFYYQNGGTYSLTVDTIQTPLFVVADGKMTINPISNLVVGGGGTPTGSAGGDLTGTYPDPAIVTSAVTSAKIADGTVAWVDLANVVKDSIREGDDNQDATEVTLSPNIVYQSGTASNVQTAFENQLADISTITGGTYRTNSISYTAHTTSITSGYWGEWGKYINNYDHFPDSLHVSSVATSAIHVRYFRFTSASTVTLVDTDTFNVVPGDNSFKLDTTGKDLLTSRLYLAIQPVVSGGIQFRSVSPDSVGFQIVSNVINTYPFSISFHISYKPTVPLQEQADKLRIWTSVSNDTMSWRDLKNALDNYDIINLPAQTIYIPYKINVPSNRQIRGVKGQSILRSSNANGTVLEINGKTNVSISGVTFWGKVASPYDITSSSVLADSAAIRARTNQQSEFGLVLINSNNIYISDVEFKNFAGAGLEHRTAGNTPAYNSNVQANGLWFYNCYIGLWLNEGEYSNYNTVAANNCLIGMYIEGGNNTVTNVTLANNRVGLVVSELTGNSAHGSVIGGSINHNPLHGIYCLDIQTGQNLVGLQYWSNGTNAYLKNCNGVKFTGCHLSSSITVEGGLQNVATGCSFGTDIKPTVSGGTLLLSGNTSLAGTNLNLNNSPPVQISGSGTPVGAVTPNYIGQEYLDTVTNLWYKAYGLVNTNWTAL